LFAQAIHKIYTNVKPSALLDIINSILHEYQAIAD
jgi:hypothetical protein